MPSEAVSAFLARFPAAKATGGQWLVRCPAHEDVKASLAVKEGDDGCVLLHDHAGCSTDQILAALGLEASALFPSKEPRKRIEETYDYRDERGVLLYQTVRYYPKDFRQRRPNGSKWIWDLDTVRRILYRLPELQGQTAVCLCEGEKDCNALWKLTIPATTNACGAKAPWLDSYTDQLKVAGARKVAIFPDNDVPGRQRATTIARILALAGLRVQLVVLPNLGPKGDVSNYLESGHSREDLLTLIRATPVWTEATDAAPPSLPQRIKQFERLDEGHYRWAILPPGVEFEIDHLRRYHTELSGQLTVRCDLAGSTKSDNGALLVGHLNLSSLSSRKTWSKELATRANTNGEIDWFPLLDNFCNYVGEAEKEGEPVVSLTGTRRSLTTPNWYTINGLTLHQRHPSCVFGWGGVGKSYVALYCAGTLANQGIRVLYVDAELDHIEHDERCALLFGEGEMQNLLYVRIHNLQLQRDYLKKIINQHQIQYGIFDSITKLAGGKLEESETAKGYIDALDSLKIGSLNIAHITKSAQSNDIRPADQKIFGASQWDQLLRHSWFVKGDGQHPCDTGGTALGFYLTKSNSGRIGQSIGWRFELGQDSARFSPCDLVTTELAKHEPLKVRLTTLLGTTGKLLSYEQAAEELGVKPETIRKTVQRHTRSFRKLENPDGKTTIGIAI